MDHPQEFLKAKENAIQKYEGARHLLNVTYRTVNDANLLIGILNNMVSSMESSIEAILAYERVLKLVPAYGTNAQSRLNTFCHHSMHRNNIPPEFARILQDMKEVIELHKKSPSTFQRGNKLVICDQRYELKVLSMQDFQDYLGKTKLFLDLMQKAVSRYGQDLDAHTNESI